MRSMKKRLLFATTLLLVTGHLLAQEVESRPVSENHKRWVHLLQGYYKTEYFTEGDTVIGGKQCYQLYEKESRGESVDFLVYYGAIFDEGKKTFFISPNSEEPKLLLDFNVIKGDSLMIMDKELWVEKDTVIQSCSRLYRHLLIHNLTNERADTLDLMFGITHVNPGYWIEGIGSTASPYFNSPAYWYAEQHYRLVECYVEGELIYRDPRYNPQVDSIESPQSVSEGKRDTLYDLSGRRVSVSSVLPKGAYIQNGKKFVIK